MPDREKVIKGLDCEEYRKCAECPYVKFGKCNELLMRDAKELLKEQDDKIRQLRLALQIMNGNGIRVDTGGR